MQSLILLFLAQLLAAPAANQADEKAYVIFYYGASSCGPCSRPEMIKSINLIKTTFAPTHARFPTKLVMVVMDEDLDEGMAYLGKYEFWDEVSIGSHYRNEHVLRYLATQEMPGVPHVLVFEDVYAEANYGTTILKERTLVAALLGAEAIVEWVAQGFPLEESPR